MLNLAQLTNPVWRSVDNLRDPGVMPVDGGYWLFYSRFSGRDWGSTPQAPLIGRSAEAYDGVENVAVFRTGETWTMIYSEGLADQHLAYAQSSDLRKWTRRGQIDLPRQSWMVKKYGAPCILREGDRWVMVLMGTDKDDRTSFGLLSSDNGINWQPLPESR